jgi:menaquinone-dependent protoporphyrinogen oxidase
MLDREQLSLGERSIVRMVKAPYGDFRDWDAVAEFAAQIDSELVVRLEHPVGVDVGTDGA